MDDVKIKLKKIKLCRTLVKDIDQYFSMVINMKQKHVENLYILLKTHGIIDPKISWDYDRLSDTIKISFYDLEIGKNYGLKFIINNNIYV